MDPDVRPVALVTGSGKRRLGYYIATALAQKGCALAIHYNTSREQAAATVAEIQMSGADAQGFQADLTDASAVENLVASVITRFGRLDALIHCAGIWEPMPLENVTAADVRRHFEINTLSAFLCARAAGLAMVRQATGGAVILFGDWAIERPYTGYAAYFASKGAIPTITRTLAVELGKRNPRVRVNCIHPGPLLFPADLPDVERLEAIRGTLTQSEGRPDDAVSAVQFLIENSFVTGICVPVDGGRTICPSSDWRAEAPPAAG
jgi:pteridine reductase